MKKSYISIDYVWGEVICSNIGVLFLRVRNQGTPIVDTALHGRMPCILLTKNGCKLDYKKRPTGGRLLRPSSTISRITNKRECYSQYGIEECCYEWKPHQKILHQLVEYFKEKDFPCLL